MFKLTYFEGKETIIFETGDYKKIVKLINKLRAERKWYLLSQY